MTKKYEITQEVRDQIINYLTNVTVPSTVGASLISIAEALKALPEIKVEEKVTKTPKANKS